MSAIADARAIAIVTGGNSGIGKETVRGLARAGRRVILAGRDATACAAAAAELSADVRAPDRVSAWPLDLASLASVRAFATRARAELPRLDILVCNAGVWPRNRRTTADGFELAFGVNHLGHFLLTNLLLDRLRGSAPARIVHVASGSHFKAKGLDWDAVRRPTASISGLPEYAASKLGNVLFCAELARRLEGTNVTTYAVNPGRVASNIWQRLPWPIRPLFKLTMLTTQQGAYSTIRAASDLDGESGRYYDRRARPQSASAPGRDLALASELWSRSEAWVA